jgi:class 3 adenylate cyclase
MELHKLHPDKPGSPGAAEPSHPSAVERKLVTILSADVAEYSRLMAEDEEQTLRIFRDYSLTFMALVGEHHGRVFNTAGDAILAEFASPVEAVRCATEIQAALRTRNDQLQPIRQVRFRIGVNLGDVMVQNSDLLGDGVNVASRLQGAAEPGGICISGSVYDQIRNKLTLGIEPLGERRFKNIPQPVRTFTIAGTGDRDAIPAEKKAPARPGALAQSGVALIALLVLGGGYWTYSAIHKRQPQASSAAKVVAPQPVAVAKAAMPSVEMQSSALLADAQRLHRPQRELGPLTDANTKIAALASQLHELDKAPDATAKAAPLIAQMNDLAANTSRGEVTALARASKLMWRDMDQPLGKTVPPDAAAAIAAANQAKTNLDDAVAAAQNEQDPTISLNKTGQALAAYDAFATAYGAAAQFHVVARRADFAALTTAAHGISDQLAAMGKVEKPWVLASRARRDAYKTLADNAKDAASQVAQMDELQRGALAASDLKKVGAALSQASTIKARLDGLLATSNAAYGVYNK